MWLSTLQHTSIHVVGPHASFGPTPTPRSPLFFETLTGGPRIVYPLDILLGGVARCSFLLFCVCLGHIYDIDPCWSQVVAISYPVSPERVVSPSYRSQNSVFALQRMDAMGDACTRVLGYVVLNIITHIHTCGRPTCKFWSYSDAPELVILRNPDRWASDRLPPRYSSGRCSPV